ncbi:MAG: ABC transporter permease [Gemmatimonadota bacterium]
MHKLWAVIRREFQTRVQSKAFVISTILGPILMGFLMVMPILMSSRDSEAKRVVVIDGAGGNFGQALERGLSESRRGNGAEAKPRYEVIRIPAQGRVQAVQDSLVPLTGLARDTVHRLDGLLIATDSGVETGVVKYLGDNVGSPSDMTTLENITQGVLLTERLQRRGVDPVLVREAASGRVQLETSKVSEGRLTGESGASSFLLAYAMAFILYLALLIYGIQVMSSVLEEKSNRIMEVLASSLTPFQLMAGKVVGVGAVGLLQLGIWVGSAMLLTSNAAAIAGLFHMPPGSVTQMPLPSISPALLIVFLAFFTVGFFLFAGLYAAVGAMCNTMQEAQQASTAVTVLVATAFFSIFSLLNDPNGSLARVFSLIPFFAPIVMPVRFSLTSIPLYEVALSFAITVLGLFGVAWIAGRIYRVGILMYGKKPSLKELFHWIRTG